MGYLLDNNVVINYLDASLPITGMQFLNKIIDEEPIISIITKIETLGFNFKSWEEKNTMEFFIDNSHIININDYIVKTTITIRQNYRVKLPDAIIAATAIVYSLTLISRNSKDFKDIKGLNFIDPHNL